MIKTGETLQERRVRHQKEYLHELGDLSIEMARIQSNFYNISPEKANELAFLLKELLLCNNPKALLKPNVITTWAKTFALMVTQDNRDPEVIAAVIRWSQADDFERTNVLSANKVRSRFDSLYLKMNCKNSARSKQQAPVSKYTYVNEKEEAGDDN